MPVVVDFVNEGGGAAADGDALVGCLLDARFILYA